jgi:hypothetical protein
MLFVTIGVVPVSSLVRNLEKGVTTINLSHHGLGPKGAIALAEWLKVA